MRNVKQIFVLFVLLISSTHVLAQQQNFTELNIRGSFNAWSATPMTLVSDNTWAISVTFGSGSNERFKFDVFGDWSQNYGDNNGDGIADPTGDDIPITEGAGEYHITFNDSSFVYTITKGEPVNLPPVANAGSDITLTVGETAFFDASASTDPDGTIVSYEWDNGLSGVAPSQVYNDVGVFVVELTVTDDEGAVDTDTVNVTVQEESTQNFESLFLRGSFNSWAATPMVAMGNNEWQIDATFADGSNERFKFDVLGDWSHNYGDDSADGIADRTGDDILITEGAGTYRITFNDESFGYSVEKLGQENQLPVANAGADITAEFGTEIQFDGSESFDPDGTIFSYDWSNGLSGVSPSLVYDTPGTFTVTLTVTDNEGATASDNVVLTITEHVNAAPIADAGADMTVNAGDTIQFDASGSFDSDGDLVLYTWSNGMTGIMPTAVINDPGVYTITLTVTDDQGATDTDDVVVTVLDDTPVFQRNFDSLNLRGSFNSWGNTPMALVADFTWQVDVVFAGESTDRFKFDVLGDWSHNYGDNDGDRIADRTGDDIFLNRTGGEYRVTFNDSTREYGYEEIVNLPPVVVLNGGGVTVDLGETVVLDASESFDPEGSALGFSWNVSSSTESSITLSSEEAASISVTVTVSDAEGALANASTTVTFANISEVPEECFSDIEFLGDFDQDGIPDCAEMPGVTWRDEQYFDLGARLNRRDLFIELDWMDSTDLGIIPQIEALQKVREAFAAQDIGIHFDTGSLYDEAPGINPEMFDLGGGNATPYERTTLLASTTLENQAGLYNYKEQFMRPIRQTGPWYYMLMGSSQNASGSGGSSGRAEINNRNSIVTLGAWGLNRNSERNTNRLINYQAGTIMHEFGHNLNLLHGGFENLNRKPNYLSVMSYDYQLSGLPTIGNQEGDRWQARTGGCSVTITNSQYDDWRNFIIDFSHGISITLDENGIFDETVGFGHPDSNGIDWSCDGDTNDAVTGKDINANGRQEILSDHDDWGNIQFYFFNNPVSGSLGAPIITNDVELSEEEAPPAEFFQP